MFCKQTQNTIDTLLNFKIEDNNDTNKIASTSTMSKEDLCVNLINRIMDQNQNQNNNQTNNKIAAVTSKQNKGEVAELQSMLKL